MQNFMQIPPRGSSRQMGEIYAKNFYSYGNEIWDKIGYNSACVEDFCVIFAPIGGFSGIASCIFPD